MLGWFTQIFIWPMWGFITYQEFAVQSDERLGTVGWLAVTVVLLAISIMLLLMGQRKLPVYLIEDDET